LTGNSVISRGEIVAPVAEVEGSSAGVLTAMVSCTPPTCMVTSKVTTRLSGTSSVAALGARPGAVTVSV
jgi:hypothetical protein